MSVTDRDRAEARALWGHCMDHEGERGAVELIAQALADERERARAPFLALASHLDDVAPDPDDETEWSNGHVDGQAYAADRIRRAAKESQ